MNYQRRTNRGNVGPWRAYGMACFHCHKLGHIAKFCRDRMNQLVNHYVEWKGKKMVYVEETRSEMNKIWKKKSEDKPSKESNSLAGVENLIGKLSYV